MIESDGKRLPRWRLVIAWRSTETHSSLKDLLECSFVKFHNLQLVRIVTSIVILSSSLASWYDDTRRLFDDVIQMLRIRIGTPVRMNTARLWRWSFLQRQRLDEDVVRKPETSMVISFTVEILSFDSLNEPITILYVIMLALNGTSITITSFPIIRMRLDHHVDELVVHGGNGNIGNGNASVSVSSFFLI